MRSSIFPVGSSCEVSAGAHLDILLRASLVRAKRVKQWTFYCRDEARLVEVTDANRETV